LRLVHQKRRAIPRGTKALRPFGTSGSSTCVAEAILDDFEAVKNEVSREMEEEKKLRCSLAGVLL